MGKFFSVARAQRCSFAILLACTLSAGSLAYAEPIKRVYSEDGRMFAFVKQTAPAKVDPDDQEQVVYSPELIELGDVKTGKFRTIMSQKSFSVPNFGPVNLALIDDLCFGSGDKELFFRVRAWTMSDAVLALKIDTHKLRFVCPGNHLRIAKTGKWKGHLIVEQHNYFESKDGGSYDWQFVISPTGKQLAVYEKHPVEEMNKLDRMFSRLQR